MELEILYALQTIHTTLLDSLMVFVTTLGDTGIFWIICALAMLCFRKTRQCGLLILFSMLVCLLLGNVALKNLVARPRPCWIDPSVPLLLPNPQDYSFPSGHTMHSFAAATVIFKHYPRTGVAALCLASLIAVSRMYLFVHFPTDILGGLCIGVAVAWAVCLAHQKRQNIKRQKAAC